MTTPSNQFAAEMASSEPISQNEETQTQDKDRTGSDPENLTSVLDQMLDGSEGDEVSLESLMHVFKSRVYGPLMLIPALLATAPTGAIPGVSILTGVILASLSLQLLFFQKHPWLPARLLQFKFPRKKLVSTVEYLRPFTKKTDQYIKPRLDFLVQPPLLQVAAVLCFIHALLMFPLALLPFAVMLPGLSIVIISLGITSRDGLLMMIGMFFSIVVFCIIGYSYFS